MTCDRCSFDFDVDTSPGALVFSPPLLNEDDNMYVEKYHVCQDCYVTLENWLRGITPDTQGDKKC